MVDNLNSSFLSCSSSESFQSACSSIVSSSPYNLCDKLSNIFSQYKLHFNIAHINAQSIPSHYPDLLASFNNVNIDALLISESFLKPSLSSAHYTIPGFVLLRNDRTGKGGGGVAMYIRSNIIYKILIMSPSLYSESAEYLAIEITAQHTKLLLIVLYSPNSNIDYFDSLDNLLTNFRINYQHVIIMGDFNTCLLKANPRSEKLLSLLNSFNLYVLPTAPTHYFPDCSPSLLDLMIVSSSNNVATHGQLDAPFSYHDLVFLSFKIKPPKRVSPSLSLRSFNKINQQALESDAKNLDWTSVLQASCVNVKVENFNNIILNLYDHHAPVRVVKLKHNPAPWLTDSIKEQMAARDKAKRKFKLFPTQINHTKYKILRNRCNYSCRDAKRRYFYSSLLNRGTSDTWKFLKSVGIGKSPVSSCNNIDLNDLNKHFSQPPTTLNKHAKFNTLQYLSQQPINGEPFSFLPYSEDKIRMITLSISSEAAGYDKVSSKMIKLILPFVLPILTHIFNFSLSSCCFPHAWKMANIRPLPKVSNPTSLSCFRPISILPFLSKILEHIVYQQLSSFLIKNNHLNTLQSGFRGGHSTVSALINVTDDIRWAMENKSLSVLVLLDFTNAFNSIDFDILLGMLKSLNLSPSVLSWFISYLRGRSQRVQFGNDFSNWCYLEAGVPQGGVLSPLLFSIFINFITKVITSKYHLYADDLQIYRHFTIPHAGSAIALINDDLDRISEWANAFGLLVNPAKTKSLLIGSRRMLALLNKSSLPSIILNGTLIPFSDSAKNLGVIFDSHLSWITNVNNISRKVYHSLHSLKLLQNFLPVKTKILLAQTLIQPIIDYADVCYLDANEDILNKLERLQNLLIRFVFGLKKRDHVSQYRKQLQWLPIRYRRNYRVLCFLFNTLFSPIYPSYLKERFSLPNFQNPSCRSFRQTLLDIPCHRTDFFAYSFTVHAAKLWNSLPAQIRECKTLGLFKKRLREHYLSLN